MLRQVHRHGNVGVHLGYIGRKRSVRWCSLKCSDDGDKKRDEKLGAVDARSGWRYVEDWDSVTGLRKSDSSSMYSGVAEYSDLTPSRSDSSGSPVEKCVVRERIVYVKRDDLLHLCDSNVSGNKARKLLALNSIPAAEFPQVVASFGGPQSNAMLALAAVVHSKNTSSNNNNNNSRDHDHRFVYFTKKLPRWLKTHPSGNYLRAVSLGMELVELDSQRYQELFASDNPAAVDHHCPLVVRPPVWGDSLWIPQGAACGVSILGARQLAREIKHFWSNHCRQTNDTATRPKLAVCLPGGTCTTALFLCRELRNINDNDDDDVDITVVVIPCVGDAKYARYQMKCLDLNTRGDGTAANLPLILEPCNQQQTFVFGQPHTDILSTYKEMMDEYDIYLDLLYGAPAWTIMLQHWNTDETQQQQQQQHQPSPLDGRLIMYVHSGGLEGNASQIARYKQKGLVPSSEAM